MIRNPLLYISFACAISTSAYAALSMPTQPLAATSTEAKGPSKDALETFRDGKFKEAVEMAKPLAEKGNADAIYLLGYAHETGQGATRSTEDALAFYRKAVALNHKDSTYRLAVILLNSKEQKDRDEAKKALENLANSDASVAGRILGEAYLQGVLSEKSDPKKAIEWWEKSSKADDMMSTLTLARLYEGQLGYPELKNSKQSIAYFEKAAEAGNPAAMAALGSRLLIGEEKIRNEAKGREWINKAIKAGEISAHLALGDFEETVKKNSKAALAAYERGKDAGQVDCIIRCADFYIEGKVGEKDAERGLNLLQQAAKAGSPIACFRLAVPLLSVEKIDSNQLMAGYQYLLTAAKGNLVEAQNELGLFYLSGKLGVEDSQAGIAWLTRAAQSGNATAQNNLATLFESGQGGLPQNIENAGQLYALAANQGNGPAIWALARLTYQGVGTEKNNPKAWALATMALERGYDKAQELIDTIAKDLDAKQLEAAKAELTKLKTTEATPAKEESQKPTKKQ